MYNPIKKFLLRKGCDPATIVEEQAKFYKEGKSWIIDVAGIRGAHIYGVEAKVGCGYNDVIDAIIKARFYKYACSYVYVCFPKASYEQSSFRNFLDKECKEYGIGLLLLNSDFTVEECIKPRESRILDLDIYLEVLGQLKPFRPCLSSGVQGARAYIIRDICTFVLQRGYFDEGSFIEYIGEDNERYWLAQRPGSRGKSLKELIRSRVEWSFRASQELGLIESREGQWHVTLLGKVLAFIAISSKNVKKPSLNKYVKAFFLALAWQYPEVKEALAFLRKRHRASWTYSKCLKCGNHGYKLVFEYPPIEEERKGEFFIADGKVFCGKCKRILKENEISIRHHVARVLNRDYYEQLVFWFNSEVLPVKFTGPGGKYVEYYEAQLIQPTLMDVFPLR